MEEKIQVINIRNKFMYHAPTAEQLEWYEQARKKFEKFAQDMFGITEYEGSCPAMIEAIKKLEEAQRWYITAISQREIHEANLKNAVNLWK
jgi:hypothetical protein